MKFANFVHLHSHTQYSLLDGACRIDALIARAVEYKMPAVAMTDHGNMFGAIEFYKAASKAGIKPILGMEAYIASGSRHDKKPSGRFPDGGFHLLLLAKNLTGYKNLMKLTSGGYLEGFYHRPRIDKELLRAHSEGIIATSACMQGEVNWFLLNGGTDEAVAAAREYEQILGKGNFYLEIQNHGLEKEQVLIPKVTAVSRETGIPMVATNDCHYLHQQDWEAHDALVCIQTGKMVSDTDRLRYNTDQIYFKSADEMKEALGDYKDALENTLHIAESCNVELELGRLLLPVYPIEKGFKDADSFLRAKCEKGLSTKYPVITPAIQERLEYELKVIRQMGYAGYFLIVQDFCDYARRQAIRVGPGRGSAAGSLVSYALEITSIDPLKFDLLFERFLNPDRISMPDIDIDFADRGRDKIIQYVIQKYGKENVCQIITFGTMAARAVVRDVGRVLGIPYGDVDKIAKMIPLAPDMTLDKAIKQVPELSQVAKNDPRIEKLLAYSKTLEGLARHCSTHAAGVVIAPSALTNYVPLFKSSDDEITTQYDMKMVEEVGLLKMDFLGLRTLTVIDDSLRLIHENHPAADFDIDNLALDDKEVYKLFSRGDTIGIFQFESQGMRDYLRKLQPEIFTDLAVMNALYRPGPLDSGMIDIFIERKRSASTIKHQHPALEKILGSTYGVIVFQEQVLQIANNLAGYSMGKADILRKAMGKKDASLMADQKKEFLSGAESLHVNSKVAEDIFTQIETFARYGFNKAHSTCYAFVAYQTAWLKTHYPTEFMAALMSSEVGSSDRIYILLEEARKMGIAVLPPDVNKSGVDFSVAEGKIRFGLQAIKNVGEGAAGTIVAERANGDFATLADLASRVGTRSLNKRSMESLIASGSCDSLDGNRAQKFSAIQEVLDFAGRVSEKSASHDLFAGAGKVTRVAPPLKPLPEWGTTEKLAQEKATLGFYISGHPLDAYRDELKTFTTGNTAELSAFSDGREITIGGVVSNIKTMLDKKGRMMGFVTIEDYTGQAELIIFSDCFERNREHIAAEKMVLVSGKVSTREGDSAKVIVSEILPLDRLADKFTCQLIIKIEPGYPDTTLDSVLGSLEQYAGTTAVLFAARENGSEVYIRSKKYAVKPELALLSRLKELLGDSSVFLRPLNRKEH
jgi:DNA polymerase III subunit alpha